jgi:LacI family transcriptional regulator
VSDGLGRATIGDVADRAGVSIATVSRVVNDRYGVASATAARVREAIDELGYESNLIARSMRSQRTDIIGVMVSGIEPFSSELLKGIASELRDSGLALIVYSGGMSGEEGWERRYLSRLSDTLADGTILVTPTVLDVDSSHPIVAVDPHIGGSAIPTVASQNYEGAVAATEHLIGLGHRRIGFLGGRPDLESARRREAGYRAALEAAGIRFEPELIQVGGYTEETAQHPAEALLGLPERPTAIFASNDLSAIQVLRTAREFGLRVPDDLALVGFDNIPESALTEPPLTTVDQSIQAQGREAVRILIGLINEPSSPSEPSEPVHLLLPTQLIVRRSSAPPAR